MQKRKSGKLPGGTTTSQGLGKRFTAEVREKVGFTRKNPTASNVRYDDVRTAVLNIFPYMVHYNNGEVVYKFENSLKDHLGNCRVVFSGYSNVGEGKVLVIPFITDLPPGFLVLLFFHQLVKVVKNQFYIFVLFDKFLFNLLYIQF